MYVNPFWLGVAATILVEVAIIVVAGTIQGMNKHNDKEGDSNGK